MGDACACVSVAEASIRAKEQLVRVSAGISICFR